jgi:DNA-binding HxlR family transcriptional regulator
MSSDLLGTLHKVAEEDCESRMATIDRELRNYKSLILQIAEAKKWDLRVWVEGQEPQDLKKYEKALNMLERGNIIKGKMKYTHRSAYREYELTKKGEELAKKLQEEP